mmetsp:Transcript_14453/g.2370  ORF Transcript_14453/g.2370 Transcript_14453/m.2370 type:complete len:181 (+) Transcript_14453:790-1332(+)
MYWAYIMNEYKVFGLSKKVDDKFLSWLGSLGNIVGMASRTLWGIFMDIISFKLAFGVITGMQLLNSLTIYFIASNKWCYVTWIGVMYLVGCGNFVCVNIQCSINYGKFGEKVFGLAATGMALSTFSTMFVEFFILETFGFMITFYFLSIMNLLAFIFSRLVVKERISVNAADKTVPLIDN